MLIFGGSWHVAGYYTWSSNINQLVFKLIIN
jgi:hypothetical protein